MSGDNQAHVIPIINPARCSGCGVCVDLCPTHAVDLIGGRAMITRPDDCTFCEVCESYCPEGAIGRPFTVVFAPGVAPTHYDRPGNSDPS